MSHKQLQKPELPPITLTRHASKFKVHKLHQDVHHILVEFMYVVFIYMSGEAYRNQLVPLMDMSWIYGYI